MDVSLHTIRVLLQAFSCAWEGGEMDERELLCVPVLLGSTVLLLSISHHCTQPRRTKELARQLLLLWLVVKGR